MNNLTIQFYKDGSSLMMQVASNDLFAEVVLRYTQKLGISEDELKKLKFFYNLKELGLNDGKSLYEHNISNNSIIQVISGNNSNPFMNNINPQPLIPNINPNFTNVNVGGSNQINICFILNGKPINVQTQTNAKFCELAEKFVVKAALKEGDIPKFVSNAMQIAQNDERTLSQLNLHGNSTIQVFIENMIIGA